jgi:LSM domain
MAIREHFYPHGRRNHCTKIMRFYLKKFCNHLLLQGFDEYMNLVMDDAAEFNVKTKQRQSIGTVELMCNR